MVGDQAPFLRVRLWVENSLRSATWLVIFSWGCAGPSTVADLPPRLIAHSGGIGNHHTYTNSLEALDNSLARGFGAIEVDLSWTSDQHLVLIHDWGHEFEKLFGRSPGRLTLAEFRSIPSAQGLSHLSLDDLADWLLENPDVLVITDIKEKNIDGLRLIAEKYPKHRRRFVPQIYRPDSYSRVRELGYDQLVFSLYRTNLPDRQVIDFATKNPLFGVTMPARRAMDGTLPAELAAIGVRVFAHTVNDHPTADSLQSKGVYGVYTDWLTPSDELNSHPLADWWIRTDGEVPMESLVVPFLPWEMAGMETVIDFQNTGEIEESVRVDIMDTGGRSIATSELEVHGGDTIQLALDEFISHRTGHGWLLVKTVDGVVVRPHWHYRGDVGGLWTSQRTARTGFETGGTGSGLGGMLVAIVNPTDLTQTYRLQRFIGATMIDDDSVDLEPGHQAIRVYRSQTVEETRLTVTGGPMVTQVLRWDPMGRFMR